MMKTLIACYSLTGNTLKAAESLKAAAGADFTRIEDLKEVGYIMKCLNALLKRRTPIKPCITDLKGYDAVIIGSPVWAGSAPPAVNQYIDELKGYEGKKFGIVITYGSSGQNRVSAQIMAALNKKKMSFIDVLWLTEDDVRADNYQEKVKELAAELK